MEIFLLLLYAGLFAFIISRCHFFKLTGLNKCWIVLLFGLKIGVGIVYGYLHLTYYRGGDTYAYLDCGHIIGQTFWTNPLHFIRLVFGKNGGQMPEHLSHIIKQLGTWVDTKTYIMYRINALLSLISGGFYNVHLVFFNFFALIGLVATYKTHSFLQDKRLDLFQSIFCSIILFLWPSTIFWGSGLHKEALNWWCIGGSCYHLYQFAQLKQRKYRHLLIVLIYWTLLGLIRPHMLLLLFPVSFIWLLNQWQPHFILIKYLIFYMFGLFALHIISQLHPQLNFFARLAYTQYVFVVYEWGDSDLPLPLMEPTLWGFIKTLPTAFYNTLCQPMWNKEASIFLNLVVLENLLLWSVGVVALWRWKNYFQFSPKERNWFWFCLFFAFSILLFSGAIAANIGALVRYKSIALSFLLLGWGMVIYRK